MRLSLLQINNLVFVIVSIVFCLMTPHSLDISFCQFVAATYIAHNILYFLLLERKNWMGFEFFFSIAFFFINFVYPTLIFPISPNFSIFSMSFNDAIIPKATTIAYMGYAFFLLGCTDIRHEKEEEPLPPAFHIEKCHVAILFALTLIFFFCYLLTGGLKAMTDVYTDQGDLNAVGVYSYFKLLFTVSVYLLAIFSFRIKSNIKWFYMLSLVAVMTMMLSTGSRTLTLGLALIILVSFNNNIRRFRLYEVATIMICGILLMFFIMLNRTGNDVTREVSEEVSNNEVGWLSILLDLIINNRNLYVLVDYGTTHSLTFLQGMLVDITSPIPGFSSLLIALTGQPIEVMHGGMLPTYLEFGTGSAYGLGTNMIGEAYRSFGYLGVALVMFAIGALVRISYYRGRTNQYWYLLYFLLVSHSVMYGRSPIFYDPRLVTWSLTLLFLVCFPVNFVLKRT